MKRSGHYEVVRAMVAVMDERTVSDEARRWAEDELRVLEESVLMPPAARGAIRAALEVAFEGGELIGRRIAADAAGYLPS